MFGKLIVLVLVVFVLFLFYPTQMGTMKDNAEFIYDDVKNKTQEYLEKKAWEKEQAERFEQIVEKYNISDEDLKTISNVYNVTTVEFTTKELINQIC